MLYLKDLTEIKQLPEGSLIHKQYNLHYHVQFSTLTPDDSALPCCTYYRWIYR
jgi:hypothetical protein